MDQLSIILGWLAGRLTAGQRGESAPWEVLFEQELTYTAGPVGNPPRYDPEESFWFEGTNRMFSQGDTIRLTVDGVSRVYTVKTDKYGDAYFGNRYLSFDEIDGEGDTGDDFCFTLCEEELSGGPMFQLVTFSREPGTYQVKIEREKVPTSYLYGGIRLPDIYNVYTPEL